MENPSRSFSRRGDTSGKDKQSSGRSLSPKRASQDRKELSAPSQPDSEEEKQRPSRKWKSVVDPSSGRLYYYHRESRIRTWTRPKDLYSDAAPAEVLSASKSFDDSYQKALEPPNHGYISRSLTHAPKLEIQTPRPSPSPLETMGSMGSYGSFENVQDSVAETNGATNVANGRPQHLQSWYHEQDDEVPEGQEVLLIQEERTVLAEEEEACADTGDSHEEEEKETSAKLKQQESETARTNREVEEKMISRFLCRSKKNSASMFAKGEESKDGSDSTLKAANTRGSPERRNSEAANGTTTGQTGRVLLLSSKPLMQEAAWNEEQARRLLLQALHTNDMERRKKLCHQAFEHAHEAMDLRHEAEDERIGLVIDPKQIDGENRWKRQVEDASTLTPTTVTTSSSSSPEDNLLSEVKDEDKMGHVRAFHALDQLCGTCIMHDDNVAGL